jgi:hypothetical protein
MSFASHYGKRSPLTVAVSTDDGLTWGTPKNIADDPKRCHTNPVAYFTSTGRCVLAWFEMGYSDKWFMAGNIDLRAAVFDVDWLRSGESAL